MDISAFSGENFDPKAWINKTFKNDEATVNKEAYIASVISKLQLYVQQINGAIEETSDHVLKNMPRVLHDTDMIQKEAIMLKEKMLIVKQEITKIQLDTAASMAALEKLDSLKTELQTAKQALHEADNWTVLASDIEEVFESHDLDAIASKVISMQQSLVVLANSVDYEDRKLQLESFKNRLEAFASSQLVKALTNKNIGEAKKFITMFTGMNRLSQLMQYYARCEKDVMCQEWAKIVEIDQDHSVLEWLNAFYHYLLDNWQSQVKWCQQAFGSVDMLPPIFIDVLTETQKEIALGIDIVLKQQTEPLIFLIQLKEASDRFRQNFHGLVKKIDCLDKKILHQIDKSVYSMYIGYVAQYGILEERQIVRESSDFSLAGDLMERTQALGLVTPPLSSACIRAIKRCLQLTDGAAFPGLVSAIQFCILKHLENYRNLMRKIDIEKQTKEEWSLFQICLNLLQNLVDFQNAVEELDKELVQAILATSKQTDCHIRESLLTKDSLEKYLTFVTSLNESENPTLMTEVNKELQRASKEGDKSTLDVMFTPVMIQLDRAPNAWSSSVTVTQQLPDYSYAPLEYVTQIGEYLMTLPQHLEPFLTKEGRESHADALLDSVARKTCTAYLDKLLTLRNVTPNMAKQITTDIAYLGNVLEDLGFNLSENLTQVVTLLAIPADSYQTQSTGCSAKLVATVRQMRNITSS